MAAMDLRELRKTGLEQTAPPEPELVGREHRFEVKYNDPEGGRHQDQVVSRILDGDERILVARLAARRAGVAWEQLPSAHAARIWAVATLAIQLRDPPDWLARWAPEDDQLLFSLFDVCSAHDSFFFRGDGGAGSEEEAKPRVVVHSGLPSSAPSK